MSSPLIPAATMVLLRNSEKGIQTLLLQRQSDAGFLPDHWVFPGGIIEDTDQAASVEHTALNAAVRETFEESGINICSGSAVSLSRWIAPTLAPKRFDTYFFIAPSEQHELELQEQEIRAGRWMLPEQALQMHYQQNLPILPPTLVTLEHLSYFSTCDEVMEHYRKATTTCFAPKACFWQDQLFMLYSGDAGYETEDPGRQDVLHRCIQKEGCWYYQNNTGTML